MSNEPRYLIKDTPNTIAFAAVLSLLCIVVNIIGCVQTMNNTASFIINICETIMGIYVFLYLIAFYRIPNGDHMKWVLLVFAARLSAAMIINSANKLTITLTTLIIIATSYIAGRLDKKAKNRFIMLGVFVLTIVRAVTLFPVITQIVGAVNFTSIMMTFDSCLFWLCISLAYLIRFDSYRKTSGKE